MKAASSLTTQGIRIKAKASIICTIVVSNYRMGGAFYYEREKVFNEGKKGVWYQARGGKRTFRSSPFIDSC